MNASSLLLLRQPSLFSLALLRSLARERGKQLQELLSAAGAHGHPSGMRAGFCIAQPWEGFPGLWGEAGPVCGDESPGFPEVSVAGRRVHRGQWVLCSCLLLALVGISKEWPNVWV